MMIKFHDVTETSVSVTEIVLHHEFDDNFTKTYVKEYKSQNNKRKGTNMKTLVKISPNYIK
eukprot:snap_masked-scaffold_12-processed-gene-9.14-mRNA-1 protein AED:1.00 eAED:1.00 QI:0/0/0/0/1/1/2/0/60